MRIAGMLCDLATVLQVVMRAREHGPQIILLWLRIALAGSNFRVFFSMHFQRTSSEIKSPSVSPPGL